MNPESFPYAMSAHAAKVVSEREIVAEWIVRTVVEPAMLEPDRRDRELKHALARIPEFGNRVLRVVYNETVAPWRIVTAFFDRTKRSLP